MSATSEPVSGEQIELVVVEDHPPMRQGLELLLPLEGFRIVGSAGSSQEGTRMIRARRPAVALVDIDLGDGSGTDLAHAVSEAAPNTAIVLYTASINAGVIEEAVNSGVRGLVLKSSPVAVLAEAIRAAAGGHDYVDSAVARLSARSDAADARRTTKREAQVLALLAHGMTTERVADELFLSRETVRTHVRNAIVHLGARGRLHAVILALVNGEIDLPADGEMTSPPTALSPRAPP